MCIFVLIAAKRGERQGKARQIERSKLTMKKVINLPRGRVESGGGDGDGGCHVQRGEECCSCSIIKTTVQVVAIVQQ